MATTAQQEAPAAAHSLPVTTPDLMQQVQDWRTYLEHGDIARMAQAAGVSTRQVDKFLAGQLLPESRHFQWLYHAMRLIVDYHISVERMKVEYMAKVAAAKYQPITAQ